MLKIAHPGPGRQPRLPHASPSASVASERPGDMSGAQESCSDSQDPAILHAFPRCKEADKVAPEKPARFSSKAALDRPSQTFMGPHFSWTKDKGTVLEVAWHQGQQTGLGSQQDTDDTISCVALGKGSPHVESPPQAALRPHRDGAPKLSTTGLHLPGGIAEPRPGHSDQEGHLPASGRTAQAPDRARTCWDAGRSLAIQQVICQKPPRLGEGSPRHSG